MPALPRKFALSLQASLRFMILATALIALFLWLRRSYLMTAFDIDETIERARNVPLILTLVAAVLAATFPAGKPGAKAYVDSTAHALIHYSITLV